MESPERVPEEARQSRRSCGPKRFTRWALWRRQVRVWRTAGCLCESRAGPHGAPGSSPGLGLRTVAGREKGRAGWAGAAGRALTDSARGCLPPSALQPAARGALDPGAPTPGGRPASRRGFRLTSLCLEFAAASPDARSQFHGPWAPRGARDRKPAGARRGLVRVPGGTGKGAEGALGRRPAESLARVCV